MGWFNFVHVFWCVVEMVRLAVFIKGKRVVVDVSVLMYAIMADMAVSGVREGSTVYYAEVFRWLNTWFQHKGLAEALHIIFVFDGDLRLKFQHCPDCQRQAQTRMDAKNKVAGAARAAGGWRWCSWWGSWCCRTSSCGRWYWRAGRGSKCCRTSGSNEVFGAAVPTQAQGARRGAGIADEHAPGTAGLGNDYGDGLLRRYSARRRRCCVHGVVHAVHSW